ncbi:cobalamin-binding protein [Undibacterium jejuense]|uniref:Cobalamin-binding protein n=1 Tax=Undibacterium jejuense TaxID=1344949 RepID=A0A923HF59_9BURK|nr:cobalamin-binding protein [Undibacterium jejuense]MBC3861910.1 cobalamin-binding protein [Undibacterium jejuense]
MLHHLGSFFLLSLTVATSFAAVSVKDDAMHTVTLTQPAQRIVSLAPHATELLFEAGAAKSVVAVSDYSNFPEAAKNLPSVGNVFAMDTERLLAIKPDLVVIWGTGNGKVLASKLRSNHITVFESEPRNYEMVATSIERLSILAGTETVGKAAAAKFRQRLEDLRKTYRQPDSSTPVTVFYEVWNKPLMTLNDEHMISAAIRLCGGRNVFGRLKELSPTITTEALLSSNPDAIITGGENADALNEWRSFKTLTAVKKNHLYAVKGDLLNRAGPRILDGTEVLCKQIALAREK